MSIERNRYEEVLKYILQQLLDGGWGDEEETKDDAEDAENFWYGVCSGLKHADPVFLQWLEKERIENLGDEWITGHDDFPFAPLRRWFAWMKKVGIDVDSEFEGWESLPDPKIEQAAAS